MKLEVSAEIMATAINLAEFNKPLRPPKPRWTKYEVLVIRKRPNSNYENANVYFLECLGKFDHLIQRVFERVVDIGAFPPDKAQKHVQEVLLPLLRLIAEPMHREAEAHAPPGTNEFLKEVIKRYIAMLSENPHCTTKEDIRALVYAMALPGMSGLFISRYVAKSLQYYLTSFH